MRSFLVILTVLLFSSGFAQRNYQKGSVVLRNGQVLIGDVADRREGFRTEISKRIKIRVDGKLFAKKFGPRAVERYTIGTDNFISLPIITQSRFLKTEMSVSSRGSFTFFMLLEEGVLNLLGLEYFDQDLNMIIMAFYLKKENDPQLVRATQGVFGLKKKNLIAFLQECNELVELIENKKITSPNEVVIFYNDWVKANPQ